MNMLRTLSGLLLSASLVLAGCGDISPNTHCGYPDNSRAAATPADVLISSEHVTQYSGDTLSFGGDGDCGPTAAANVLISLGTKVLACELLTDLRGAYCCEGRCDTRVTLREIMLMLASRGISADHDSRALSEDELVNELAAGRPIIIGVHVNQNRPGEDQTLVNHVFAVVGYNTDPSTPNGHTLFVVDDDNPSQVAMSYAEFVKEHWSETVWHVAKGTGEVTCHRQW